MGQEGEINLDKVKARYSVKDITFVDIREVDFANEQRLSFEIGFAIALPALTSLINNFNTPMLLTGILFSIFGIVSLIRYKNKKEDIKEEVSPPIYDSTFEDSIEKLRYHLLGYEKDKECKDKK